MRFKFYVDDSLIVNIDHGWGWQTYTDTFQPGIHTFKWVFSISGGSTRLEGWLDAIRLYPDVSYANYGGTPLWDTFEDFSLNGIPDAYEDFDGNGVPDMYADLNSNGIPDGYEDANANGQLDGFEDMNANGALDFVELKNLIKSASHPLPNRWYFDNAIRLDWTGFFSPGGYGYLYRLDNAIDTVVSLTNSTFTADTSKTFSGLAHDEWYFHIASLDSAGQIIEASRQHARFNVNLKAPAVVSSTHEDSDLPSLNKDFVADVAFSPEIAMGSFSNFYYVVDNAPDTVPGEQDTATTNLHIVVPGNAVGEHWFHVVAKDYKNHLSVPAHYRFIVAEAAPIITSSTHREEAQKYPGRDVTISWSEASGMPAGLIVSYYYAFDDIPDTETSLSDLNTTGRSVSFSNVEVGTHYFHVRSKDQYGFLSPMDHFQVNIRQAVPPRICQRED